MQSGFAYLSGNIDEDFLNDIYDFMIDRSKTGDKRFLLMSKDKYILDFFKTKDDISMEERYLFKYVSTKEIDIGIETNPKYKKKGKH